MALTIKQTNEEFELLPTGQYIARCFKVIDLGTQTVEWQGSEKLQPKIMISWEILDKVKMKDGKPFAVTQTYTASLDDRSNLYRDLTAWRGKPFTPEELLGFDISKLLGAYCQIQVVHTTKNDKTYVNLNAIMNTKERPKAANPDVMFDVNNPDMDIFNSLTDYTKAKIRASQEWQAEGKGSDAPLEIVEEKDVVIEDIDDEPINLDDIPF